MFYVYIIKSEKDGRLYKGMTENVDQRLKWHNEGKTKSTKGYRPWKLVYQESFESRIDARTKEKYYKTGQGREALKNLLRPRSSAE